MSERASPRVLASAALLASMVAGACTGDDVVLYRVTHGSGAGPGSGATDSGVVPELDAGEGGNGGDVPTSGGSAGSGASGAGPGAGGSTGGRSSGGAAGQGAGGRGTGGGVPSSCVTSKDCPGGWTCEFHACSDATGSCEPRPILCDPQPVPVCGCDGVTYWNDCVRQQYGVAAATIGQCGITASPCDQASDCGFPEASCAHVVPETLPCSSPSKGSCWIVPTDCAATPQSPRWVLCPAPGTPPGTPLQCESTCAAIRSGLSYVAISPGPGCP
ncbi:MAG TPA: hypothetical protein VHE30_13590 [Polyangiaceae bacterium]|nr:hypothetical protein [Polyangiaceae bacterium]